MRLIRLFLFLFIAFSFDLCNGGSVGNIVGGLSDDTFVYRWPSIAISVLVRNKAHSLPYFFSCLNNVMYPKHRIYIWIASDHNSDNSIEIIKAWAEEYGDNYNKVYLHLNYTAPETYADEERTNLWSPERFKNVISLRQKALRFAGRHFADYHLMLDADVYLTNHMSLSRLIEKDVMVVAPMLISDGLYSNFWGAMSSDFYYQRSDDYGAIVSREKRGCFEVPMVHSAVLVNLRYRVTNYLSYEPDDLGRYSLPEDDIIAFAVSAREHGVKMHVCNDDVYGYVQVPMEERRAPAEGSSPNDEEQLLNVKMEALGRGDTIPLDPSMSRWVRYPIRTKLGMDQIYMINLVRRQERRDLMMESFKELGMDVKWFRAVDGSTLDLNNLQQLNITLMPGYRDPYHQRPMTAGEIGCFLSHYYIWQEVVEKNYRRVMVLEDDIHFAPYFRRRLKQLLEEIAHVEWDLVYLGRKILSEGGEASVTSHTVRPRYSYWTLGYLVSGRGARRLLEAAPLARLLPVDEFLPIMFNEHPNGEWSFQFLGHKLMALSASPLLLSPTHYTGQPGYVSDTEDSPLATLPPAQDPALRLTLDEL